MLRPDVLTGVVLLIEGALLGAAPSTPARSTPAQPPTTGGHPRGIIHQRLHTVFTGKSLTLRARLSDDLMEVAQLRLYYRWGTTGPFLRKTMAVDNQGRFVGCVPGDRRAAAGLHYYLEAVDMKGRRRAGYGTRHRPIVVETALPPPSPTSEMVKTCPDGAGQRAVRTRPSRAQLRRATLRARYIALEDRGRRHRKVGRSLVYTGLLTLAVGGGFVGYGLSEGPVFLWAGVGIAGVATLLAIIGAPLWAKGARELKRAHQQLVNPQADLQPAERHHRHQRWWSLPSRGPSGKPQTIFSWQCHY